MVFYKEEIFRSQEDFEGGFLQLFEQRLEEERRYVRLSV
jgi:hypothetical protein